MGEIIIPITVGGHLLQQRIIRSRLEYAIAVVCEQAHTDVAETYFVRILDAVAVGVVPDIVAQRGSAALHLGGPAILISHLIQVGAIGISGIAHRIGDVGEIAAVILFGRVSAVEFLDFARIDDAAPYLMIALGFDQLIIDMGAGM